MEPLWDKPDAGPSPSNHELQPEVICNLQELPELGVMSATTRSVQAVALGAMSTTTRSIAPSPLQMRDSEVARNLQADLDVEAAAEVRIPETVKCEFEPLLTLLNGVVSQWSEVVDPKGRTYYWNKTTQETSWITPPGLNNSVQTQVRV